METFFSICALLTVLLVFFSKVDNSGQDELPMTPPPVADSFMRPPGIIQCPKLCANGEFAVTVGNEIKCGKMVQLGDRCSSQKLCSPAFSVCSGGTCKCLRNFKKRRNQCIPQNVGCPSSNDFNSRKRFRASRPRPCSVFLDDCEALYCTLSAAMGCRLPMGKPYTPDAESLSDRFVHGYGCIPPGHSPSFTVAKDATKRRIKRQPTPEPMTMVSESCPNGHFCYLHASYPISDCKVKAYGHCCPHSCPMGLPHPTASCERDATKPCSNQPGYYCRRSYLTEDTVRMFGKSMDSHFLATCCPSHCPPNMIALAGGQCLPKASAGESCWHNEQCPYTVSCNDGVCGCRKEEILMLPIPANSSEQLVPPPPPIDPEAPLELPPPIFEVPAGEFGIQMIKSRFGFRCVSEQQTRKKLLGDPCSEGEICSPSNSVCDGMTCVCACGYEKSNDRCVKKSVEATPPCVNKNRTCRRRKIRGECESNQAWMKRNCPKICNFCQ